MRPFFHSPFRNGCEVWGPQLHLVPALPGWLLAHALSPQDPPASCGRVLRQRDWPRHSGGVYCSAGGFLSRVTKTLLFQGRESQKEYAKICTLSNSCSWNVRLGKTKWEPSTVRQLLQPQLWIVLYTCECMCWFLVWSHQTSTAGVHHLLSYSLLLHSSVHHTSQDKEFTRWSCPQTGLLLL